MPRFSFPMFASALVRALLVACIGGITIVAASCCPCTYSAVAVFVVGVMATVWVSEPDGRI